jgi:membrane protein implicated in regulation of membrane protease activity
MRAIALDVLMLAVIFAVVMTFLGFHPAGMVMFLAIGVAVLVIRARLRQRKARQHLQAR